MVDKSTITKALKGTIGTSEYRIDRVLGELAYCDNQFVGEIKNIWRN